MKKKLPKTFGSYPVKSLPLHPLSGTRRRLNKSPSFFRDEAGAHVSFPLVLPFARETTRRRDLKKKFRIYLDYIE